MNLTEQYIFQGVLTALGGASSSNQQHGSPGTVYVDVNVGDEPYRMLQVDNLNRDETFKVFLVESGTTLFRFEKVHLVRRAVLAVKQVGKRIYTGGEGWKEEEQQKYKVNECSCCKN